MNTLAVEPLLAQLAELPEHIAAAIADAAERPTPERLTELSVRLQGVSRLALLLREAMLKQA